MSGKKKINIPTQIKDPELVERRRKQIVDAAVSLFIEKGFHKTTTRQIAGASELSIGSLYEYVSCKEDVLYLVCESIHTEVDRGLEEALSRAPAGRDALAEVIREYFLVCHKMSDFMLLMYQETKTLPPKWKKKVLENELQITGLFVEVIAGLMSKGDLPQLKDKSVEVLAHDIIILGHMWIFRRWFFGRHYSIEDYIKLQTEFILNMCT